MHDYDNHTLSCMKADVGLMQAIVKMHFVDGLQEAIVMSAWRPGRSCA